MMIFTFSQFLLYGGFVLIALSIILFVLGIFWFQRRKKWIEQQLMAEYGDIEQDKLHNRRS